MYLAERFELVTTLFEEKLKQEIDQNFEEEEKLFNDILNDWKAMATAITMGEAFFDYLKPLLHYADFYETKAKNDLKIMQEEVNDGERKQTELNDSQIYLPLRLQRILELSDPETIKKYNFLVDKFNANLMEIKSTKNTEMINAFYEEAKAMVYPQKELESKAEEIVNKMRDLNLPKIQFPITRQNPVENFDKKPIKIKKSPYAESIRLLNYFPTAKQAHQSPEDLGILTAKEPPPDHLSQTI